jgi:hypothetical protein
VASEFETGFQVQKLACKAFRIYCIFTRHDAAMELDHTGCVYLGQLLDALLECMHVDGLVAEGPNIGNLVIEVGVDSGIDITAISPKRGDNARGRIAIFRWGVR